MNPEILDRGEMPVSDVSRDGAGQAEKLLSSENPQKEEAGGDGQARRASKAVINRMGRSSDALGYYTSLHFADFGEKDGDK
jgi:hypothetical protein